MSFKRIVPVLLIVCLLVGLLPITALAADVIKVAEWWIEGGTTYTEYAESNKVWETFESTWNTAMEAADKDHSKMIHFKLYTDWNADSDGDFSDYTFSSGAGFNYWTIYIPDGARVTLDLNGHMINRRLTDDTGNGEVIYVDEGAYLVIEDSDPDVVHPGEVGTDGLWRPGGSGSHKISGGIITGGYSDNGAGGIHMMEDSHVVLKGGTIAGNASTEDTFGNGGGGGIQLDGDDSQLKMYDGAAIKYNVAADNDGGGVEVWNGSFVMYGGEVSYNEAKDYGGGVHTYEDDGTAFRMYGGEISFNEADLGGGVYVDSSVVIDGGNINANYARRYGGGIYFNDNDSPVVKNASVSYNDAGNDGGGIYINTDGVKITDTEISCNGTIYGNGGGIWCSYDGLSLLGCEFIDNYAAGTGSAIYIPGSSVSHDYALSGCEIRDDNKKAGVYVGDHNTLTLSGKIYIGSEDSAWLYLGIGTPMSADGVTYSEVWLDDAAEAGSIISKDVGTHNVTGFRYIDGVRGLLWVNDPYNKDYRKIKVVSARDAVNAAEVEIVPYDYSEPEDMFYTVDGRDYILRKGIYTYSSCNDSTLDNNAIYYYSDGYFDRAPDEYDTHLATMSMNLAMSGFYSARGQVGTYYWFADEEVPYTGETDYSNRHASVRQLLADIGVSDDNIYVNDDYITRPTPDTIGVAVGQKLLRYADDTETGYTLVPVVIRSANYEQEWVSNVTLGDGSENGGEAKGFSTAADMAMEVVETYIADFGLADKVAAGKVKFWVVGYSRGGATANLLSKRLTDKYSDPANGGCQVFGYCFEAPQGGVDKAVVNASHTYNGQYLNIHNCINDCDLVPMVGPMQMGFHRYGVDHYVPGDPEAGQITATEKQVANDSPYTRNDGENYTRVTTYADNAAYHVKPVNGYIGNRSDTALATYYTQRALAEAQLRAVSQGVLLDDYFYTADINYASAIFYDLLEVTGDVNRIPRMDQWLEDFVADLVDTSLPNRTFFANTPVSLQKDGVTIGGLTFEQAIRNAIGLVFALPAEKMNALMDRFGNFTHYISLSTIGELILLWDDALGDWDAISEAERAEHIVSLWATVEQFELDEILSEDEYAALKAAWPTIADVLIRFVSEDYDSKLVEGINETQAHLGTLFYNISRIGANHYPEINLAWLRSYDSFYTTDLPGTETGVKTRVVLEKDGNYGTIYANIGQKQIYRELEFEGAQTMKLTSYSRGDAIYYTVTKDGVDDDTVHLYRNGIELLPDGEYTSYVIHAYSMHHGAKSSIHDFPIRLHQQPEPELPPLKIRSASLHIAQDINMIYAAEVPEGYTDPYMVFTINGEDHTVDTYTVNSKGQYCFELTAITPQCMGDNISATLYAKAGRKTRSVTKAEYSVRAYCASMLAKTDDPLLVTLLSDLLTYGAAAQNYTGYKTDSLVTDGIELTPSPTPRLAGLTEEFEGTADPNTYWTSASLTLRNNVDMNLYFETDDIEGLSVVLEINGRTETITEFAPAYGEKNGYQITYHGILATEFDLPVSASFYRNGVKIGNTLKYSVNAYVCSKQYDTDETLAAMVLALFKYGSTANCYYFARYLNQ